MAQVFQIRDGGRSVGSFSGDEIRRLTGEGTLHAGMQIRRLPNVPWGPLSNVKGLRLNAGPGLRSPIPRMPQSDALVSAEAADPYVVATLVEDIDAPKVRRLLVLGPCHRGGRDSNCAARLRGRSKATASAPATGDGTSGGGLQEREGKAAR